MINIFGGNHEEIGSTDKNLILKTQGKIRIQWGKKFIDLLDNDGNINCGLKNIINQVSSEDSIKKDGFYYLNGALIACVGGQKITISSESGNTFVSFLVQQDTTNDQKKIAQKNIGLYYDSKKDINVTNGIAYVEDEGTIYIINNGNISQFSASIPNPYPKQFVINKEDQTSKGSLIITGSGEPNGLMFDTLSIYSDNGAIYKSNLHQFIVDNNTIAKINQNGIIVNQISSENANQDKGYRIYNSKGKYILDIDSINVRDGIDILPNIYPLEYNLNQNIITKTKEESSTGKIKCYLKYTNTYEVGDELLVYNPSNLDKIKFSVLEKGENYIITNNIEVSKISNVKCNLVNEDLAIGEIETKYNSKNVGLISKQNIFYSTKFDKEGTGNQIYPFYSNELYNELENNISNDQYNKYIIPPYGLLFNQPLKDINKIKSNPNKNNQILLFDNGWKYNKYLVTPLKEINDSELAKPNKDNQCITYTNNKWEYVVQTKYSDFESIPFTSVNYKSQDKKIYFYNKKEEIIGQIDTTDFVKDGMVSNVYVEGKNLYITFNTDSGKNTIIIPISKIFDSSKYYTKEEVNQKITEGSASATPIGTILMWPGSNLPEGYLICNGATFDKDECPELYNILGSDKLPDLRDRFIVGAGNEYNLKDTGGEKKHTLTTNELPSHQHNFKDYYYVETEEALRDRDVTNYDKITTNNKAGSGSIDEDNDCLVYYEHKTDNLGEGQSHENRPPYYALYFIIKASNSSIIPPEPGPEPDPDPEPEPTTNMTITISNNTGSKIYASRLDFLGTTISIRFDDTYEIVSSKVINVSVNENIIGTEYIGIQIVDEVQAHCAYATSSGEGTISTVMSVTATQKFI